MQRLLSIGTRRSPLAVWQAEHIKALLEKKHPGLSCELVRIVTQGDKILDIPLAQVGGKGLFVKEIEEALLNKKIDLAVHSMKDLPSDLPPGLTLAAIPLREDPKDALICREAGHRLSDLRPGACIGTSSLRRASQIRFHRKDLITAPVRGNVQTRIRRLDEGRFDAIILALAGLKRLGQTARIDQILEPEICLPAVGQGALAIEIREEDKELFQLLTPLHHQQTAVAVKGERSFLATMEGSCQVPIACHGTLEGKNLILTGLVADLDGSKCIRKSLQGPQEEADGMGKQLAEMILKAGGRDILKKISN